MSRPPAAPVHQVLAALSYGDAIGNEALAIQRHLQGAGFRSELYAEAVHPRMAGLARPLWEYRRIASPETVCLFHFSIGSAAGRLVHQAPHRVVCIYHNITPADFFLGFHPHLAGLCYHGRRELAAFAPRAELGLGDSEFNRRELEAAGFPRTAVLPIVLELEAYRRPPSPVIRRIYGDGRTNILFVGRFEPRKGLLDLLKAYRLLRKTGCDCRLLVVGSGPQEREARRYVAIRRLSGAGLRRVLFLITLVSAVRVWWDLLVPGGH